MYVYDQIHNGSYLDYVLIVRVIVLELFAHFHQWTGYAGSGHPTGENSQPGYIVLSGSHNGVLQLLNRRLKDDF